MVLANYLKLVKSKKSSELELFLVVLAFLRSCYNPFLPGVSIAGKELRDGDRGDVGKYVSIPTITVSHELFLFLTTKIEYSFRAYGCGEWSFVENWSHSPIQTMCPEDSSGWFECRGSSVVIRTGTDLFPLEFPEFYLKINQLVRLYWARDQYQYGDLFAFVNLFREYARKRSLYSTHVLRQWCRLWLISYDAMEVIYSEYLKLCLEIDVGFGVSDSLRLEMSVNAIERVLAVLAIAFASHDKISTYWGDKCLRSDDDVMIISPYSIADGEEFAMFGFRVWDDPVVIPSVKPRAVTSFSYDNSADQLRSEQLQRKYGKVDFVIPISEKILIVAERLNKTTKQSLARAA